MLYRKLRTVFSCWSNSTDKTTISICFRDFKNFMNPPIPLTNIITTLKLKYYIITSFVWPLIWIHDISIYPYIKRKTTIYLTSRLALISEFIWSIFYCPIQRQINVSTCWIKTLLTNNWICCCSSTSLITNLTICHNFTTCRTTKTWSFAEESGNLKWAKSFKRILNHTNIPNIWRSVCLIC